MKINLLPILLLLVFSCSKQNKKTERVAIIHLTPISITDSVITSFPGSLTLTGNYLVWEDPFNHSAFLKVVDIRTGKQVAQTGTVGQGPKEFVTPRVHLLNTDKIGVTDLNRNKRAVLDIDKLLNKQEPFTYYKKNRLKNALSYLEVENNKFVGIFPGNNLLFKFIDKNVTISFGKYPITEHLTERDKYNYFQGAIIYSHNNKKLIYSPSDFPYIISYKRKGDSFTHEKILKIYNPVYSVTNSELKMERIMYRSDITISKNYIVIAQKNEYKKDFDKITGFDVLPHTLYLYDYDLNIQKIVDIKIPILRLASNEKTNTVYAIVMNPEYSIVKIELP